MGGKEERDGRILSCVTSSHTHLLGLYLFVFVCVLL
jgi:hypothetical protein